VPLAARRGAHLREHMIARLGEFARAIGSQQAPRDEEAVARPSVQPVGVTCSHASRESVAPLAQATS
jgi:hypothetical protein